MLCKSGIAEREGEWAKSGRNGLPMVPLWGLEAAVGFAARGSGGKCSQPPLFTSNPGPMIRLGRAGPEFVYIQSRTGEWEGGKAVVEWSFRYCTAALRPSHPHMSPLPPFFQSHQHNAYNDRERPCSGNGPRLPAHPKHSCAESEIYGIAFPLSL